MLSVFFEVSLHECELSNTYTCVVSLVWLFKLF
jgi:hypothetical protein